MLTELQKIAKAKIDKIADENKIPKDKRCTHCGIFGVQLFYCFNCKDKYCLEHRSDKALCDRCDKLTGVKRPNRKQRRQLEKGLRKTGIQEKMIK